MFRPVPLPFRDRTFDTVFTKDSIVDLPEKAPVFDEMFRVARPGAWIFLSDWFRSEAPFTEEMRAWATEGGETYEMDTLESAAAALSAAGFTQIETDDRNGWFRDFARDEYKRLKGPLFDTYVARFGRVAGRDIGSRMPVSGRCLPIRDSCGPAMFVAESRDHEGPGPTGRHLSPGRSRTASRQWRRHRLT